MVASVLAVALLGEVATAQEAGQEAPPPPAVTVVTLKAEDVTLTATLPGRVIASAEAELRPQVNGIIIERLFEEGRAVKKGDPLYRIDPRTYEAAVAQAEASLAQAQAQAAQARSEATRVGELRDRRVASVQTQESAIAARDAAEAAVKAAEAQVQAANIDLARTTITAPLDGVIGLAQTTQGSLVTAGQATPLAVIRTIDPVHVDVTQSAADIVRWQKNGARDQLPPGADQTVTLLLADGTPYDHTGSLTAAEPHVNETTGVVTLRMSFANPDNLLLPGMYALARIPQAELQDVVLAPQEAVTRDRRGRPLALVVNDQNIVEERLLDIVQDLGNTWVVREGLKPGDRIIVEGLQKAAVGAPVTPQERPEAPPEGADDGTATPVRAAAPADAAPAADGAAPAENAAPAADSEVQTPGETPAEGEIEKTDSGN
ncbi:efflux RND transporter periplasmic adaptor subunit [uncultured Paracoccus sp.]|uniref:efflux RND transporter periplasmic adaptor subunit n=1 Tax=uncultured Paracoccus sp. TaxID=189685 RepID=UPI00262303DB|nr:efflux RND transporter periplasmic adaptor subunit [uncultured Paracoccus sp.]